MYSQVWTMKTITAHLQICNEAMKDRTVRWAASVYFSEANVPVNTSLRVSYVQCIFLDKSLINITHTCSLVERISLQLATTQGFSPEC